MWINQNYGFVSGNGISFALARLSCFASIADTIHVSFPPLSVYVLESTAFSVTVCDCEATAIKRGLFLSASPHIHRGP